MRHIGWILVLVLLATSCGLGVAPPSQVPHVPTLAPEPTSVPAAPTHTAPPTDTPPPPSPTSPPGPAAWWDDTVFYEVFVRSFYDDSGDGKGDIQGLIEKLDYLNDGDPSTDDDLGITGLWLMPVFDSPSYHGYDVVDYYAVNPDYGTNADFERLIEEANKRGIRVIVDLVLNHTSSEHPWFQASASGPDSEQRDWYIWSETDPGYLGPWGQQVWHPKGDEHYYGLFWGGMPDLNLENTDVRDELYEVARFWLEDMGADGFRLDAARHYIEDGKVQSHTPETQAWLADFRDFTKEVNPEALSVGEIWDVSDLVAPYLDEELDLAFEFSLAKAILESVNEGRVAPLESAMKEVQRLYPHGGYATFLTNHDQNRVMDEFSRDPDKAKLAASALLTLPGVPFVYYGEEIGMTGSKPDELIRTPMQWTTDKHAGFTAGTPWEPVNWAHEDLNVDIQTSDPDSLLHHYRTLIGLRNDHVALRRGSFFPIESADRRVYAFLRHATEGQVLVVINFDEQPTTEYALSASRGPLSAGSYLAADLLTAVDKAPLNVAHGGSFAGYVPQPELPGRTALILNLVHVE